MSYNGSGTFTLNVGGYPYVANTTIVSANVNALLQDIANGLSLAVTRDGQMSMTGPLHMAAQLIDGIKNLQFGTTTSSPPVSSDGWFLTAAHTLGLATNGTVGISQNSTGNVVVVAPSSGTTVAATGASAASVFTATTVGAGFGLNVTTTSGATAVNASGPAATQLNALIWQQTGQTAWQIYQPASSSDFRLFANGADRLQITNVGNFTFPTPGSGTTVAINGGALASTVVTVTASVATTMQTWNDGTVNTELLQFSDNNLYFGNTTNHAMQLVTNNAGRIVIANSGGVTLNTPTSGNHQFNGLTDYSDGTTNAEIGWRSLPSSTFNGTLVVTQRSQLLQLNGNITVPNAVFSAGDVVVVTSTAGRTITQGASVTLTLGGTATTGSRTLAANGVATILFTSSSAALVYGAGVS